MVLAELIILMYAALWWGFASQSAVDYIVQTVGSAPEYFPSAGSRVIWLWHRRRNRGGRGGLGPLTFLFEGPNIPVAPHF